MDLKRPYLPLMQRMCASAKSVMPDCRTILLTQTPSRELTDTFDLTFELPPEGTAATLCRERAIVTASWAYKMDRPCVFADPDIEFRRPVPLDGDYDVGLLWRDRSDQPVNSGVVIAKPGCPNFWKHYGKIAINLPEQIWWWWCDQLAYSLLTGVNHKAGEVMQIDDARVALLDANMNCPTPDEAGSDAWAVHYKGQLKGEGWDKVFVNKKVLPTKSRGFQAVGKSGDGRSSEGSP